MLRADPSGITQNDPEIAPVVRTTWPGMQGQFSKAAAHQPPDRLWVTRDPAQAHAAGDPPRPTHLCGPRGQVPNAASACGHGQWH